jgi:hypothetical protein
MILSSITEQMTFYGLEMSWKFCDDEVFTLEMEKPFI